ncbi:hypothetical protein ABMA27_001860 [Loxostege sticticalis]|uniref:Uncharacterized protein n=1 Tax=Loxostege sticticalis TaxID=481309 RepID=A0ABR3HVP4_LOXSC
MDNVSISILSRKARIQSRTRLWLHNENYLIHAGCVSDFIENFGYLTKGGYWQPSAKFMIVFNKIEEDLRVIFDKLLTFHVINALVIDATVDNNLYTYNPFENYGCGKRYDSITNYGKCLQPKVENIFPDKLVTGIKNCTFNIEAMHWPPYSIHPQISDISVGAEQYTFNLLASLENFQINYTYTNNAEHISRVDGNMTVTGPLKSMKDNLVDITIGGMVLKPRRASAFDIIWSHIPFIDEVVILVRKAKKLYTWQYIFLEFSPVVWLMLALAIVAYAMFVVTVFKVEDKILFVMNMFGALLAHGIKERRTSATRYVLKFWACFAFLVSSHYLCSLSSLTTQPLNGFQISSMEDLATYNLKACVSPMMQLVVGDIDKLNSKQQNLSVGCDSLYQSMETVSLRDDAYTVSLSKVYNFYRKEFCGVSGCRIYKFPRPLTNVLYAIFLYKGFPMLDTLNQHVMRIRESGVITKMMERLYTKRDSENKKYRNEFKYFVLVPWFVLISGWIVSTLIFVVEMWLRRMPMTPNLSKDEFRISPVQK